MDAGLVAMGRQFAQNRLCASCHEESGGAGTLAGSNTPVHGTTNAFGPNLTPDPDTGLGGWTDEQIINAMRLGVDDEGVALCVMPRFGTMSDQEARAIVAYLRSLPAVANTVSDTVCPTDAGVDASAPEAAARDASAPDAVVGADVVARPDATTVEAAVPDVVARPEAGPDVAATDAGCGPSMLSINEVQTAGAGGAGDEFVELYNGGSCAVSLASFELRYASAAGTAGSRRWLGQAADMLAPRGFAVLGGASYTGATLGMLTGTTGTLAATGGGLALVDPMGTILDQMGYGASSTNLYVQGTPAAAPASGASVGRIPDGNRAGRTSAAAFPSTTAPTPGAANR